MKKSNKPQTKLRAKLIILCKDPENISGLSFYIYDGTKCHFLFQQRFRASAYNFFHNGVPVEKAIDYSKSHRNRDVINVMKRIPSALRYLELNEDVQLRNPEQRKRAKKDTSGYYDYDELESA